MRKTFSSRWLNFFLSLTMVTTQVLPFGYTQDADQSFVQDPTGQRVPVVSLKDFQEDEQAKAEAAQAEKAAQEANSYLASIKESPLSRVDVAELNMMELSSRPAKEVKLHSKAEAEEMAAMIVRSYLGNKSVQFEYEWNHPFMYASEQVIDQDNPTLFTPQQGSLTLSRKLGSGVLETYTLTIGGQGLLLSSAEVKNGNNVLSSVSWSHDSNGVKISESKTESMFDEAGNQIESRSSWKNMNADGVVTNESASETYSKYEGENLVSQTTKSSSRYDNNGTPQVSESSTSLERVYAGNVVISEISTSRGSQNGDETSGSTSTKKVDLDAMGNPVYSITESSSWSSYNGTKSESSYSTSEKSAYNENGDLIEKVTRSENKSTGYSSSSETRLFNTYEGGFLVQAVTKSSSTYNGNQNSTWSTVTNYKRDAAGRPVFEESISSYNGVENNRSSIERTYLDEKSDKLTSEVTKNFYLQGDSLKLNYQQSLKLEYNKEGVLVKTHHQQDSFYGQDNALSYRNTVETRYNADGKPVSVLTKNYGHDGTSLVLQSSSELKYRYSEKDADGKTHVTYSSRAEMNADGSVIYKETKRYDPLFSMENPSVNEPRVMYDIAMPAYSYYMPLYWGWGGGLEKGLLSREMQYFSTDENGDSFLTSTSGDRYWLDGEGKAYKQRNYTKSFNREGDKISQITQEYDLIGQPYNYGCCYAMNGDMVRSGEGMLQAEGQVSSMGIRSDALLYRPYPYYYNSGRRLTLYDELRYDESGVVSFRKTQRNEYADGLLVSSKLVIKEDDVTQTIKESYTFDALGRAAKIVRQVFGPEGKLQLTDERTYEYSGFGYLGYGYYGGGMRLEDTGSAASDKMMSPAIWAPWNAASVKSVRVSLTNHMTGESVKALISYMNSDLRELSGEGEVMVMPYDYYGGISYNAADITGTYVNSEGVSTPIQGRFKGDGNEHALPTEKLMELLISYAGRNTDPNEKAIQEAVDHFMGLFDFKGLSEEAISKIRASIHVKSARQDEWSNGCVGWNTPSMMCTMAFVRGLNITLELFGNEYEIHANRLDPAKSAAIAAINSWLNLGVDLAQVKIESSGLKGRPENLDGTLKGESRDEAEPVFVVILSNTVTLETERFEVALYGNRIISSRRFDSKGGLIYEKFADGWEADYLYNAGGGGFSGGGEGQFNKPMLWRGLTGIFLRDGKHFVHASFNVPQGNAEDAAGYLRASLLELVEREKIVEGEHRIIIENLNVKEMACTNSIPGNCFSSGELQFTLGNLRYLYAVRKSQTGSEPAVFKAEIISVTRTGSFFDLPEEAVTAIADFLGVAVPDIVDLKSEQRDFFTCMGPGCATWSYFVSVTAVVNGSKVHYAGHVTGGAWGYESNYYMRPYFPAEGAGPYDQAMSGMPLLKVSPGFPHIQPTIFLLAVHSMIDGRALNAILDKASEFGVVEEVIFEPHQDRAYCMGTGCAMWSGDLKVTVSSAKGKAVLKGEMSETFDVGTERSFSVMLELLAPGIEEVPSPVVTGTFHIPDDSMMSTLQRSVYTVAGDGGSWLIDRLPAVREMLDKLNGMKVSFIPGESFSLEGQEIFTSGILVLEDGRAFVFEGGKAKQYKNAQFITLSESKCPANPMMGAPCTISETAVKLPGYVTIHNHKEVLLDGVWVITREVALMALPDDGTSETRLVVNYEGGKAYIDWDPNQKGVLVRTDVKTGEEIKFFKALDMMSCSYPKDGPALCAGIAVLPGYEQVGSYRRDLPDGGYEERIIVGLRSENLPIEEKESPVVTGVFQMPDDSMMSTLQRSVYTITGENESWLIDRLEELRMTLDKLHGQKVSFIPGKSFSLEGREIFTSGIIITGEGIAFVIEDGKIKSYKDAQFLKVSESRCPANPAMGAPCSIEEMAMKMPGYEEIHQHQEIFVKDGWIVTRKIVLIGMPFEFKPNFIPVKKMNSAEADLIRKAVGEGLELLGYEIDDGRPYDGNLVHHYAFRAVSSSLVHMRQATNSNIIKQDANGLIYEERAAEDFGLDVFVNDSIRYIKEPDPRYIGVSAGVSRIEVAPGEQLMLSVVMELGGRRITTLRDIHTPWTFTPLTAESAFRIKAAIQHGLEMRQIGKVRMKLTGETAAKCPQGEKCSSYKEYEVLYYADGKEFLADGQIVLTAFQGKQFTYYEIQNVREAMSKEEKIRLAIEAAGQDLDALAAQMIIPENQALTEEEFAALDAKLKEIAEKMRALLIALRDKIRDIEGDNSSDGIIKMFGGPDAAIRLEQRAGAFLSDFYGRLMQTDALIVVGGQKIRIPIHKMTEILVGALPNGRWSPAEYYAQLIGYTPEFHPGDGIYLMNVFQNVMLSLAMGPSSRDLRQMITTFVVNSNAKGLVQGDAINLRVFKSLLLGTEAKINLAIKAAGEEIDSMIKSFSVSEVLSEKEVETLLADLDSLYQKIRSRLAELKKQIDELEGANADPSSPVLFMQVGGGPDGAVEVERAAEIALGNLFGLIWSRDVRIKTADGSEVVLPLSGMIEVLSSVVGKDQMYSVDAIGKVLGQKVNYHSGRIYFMHVFQFMMASRAALPDVRTALIEYVRGADMPAMIQGGKLDLNLFRLSLLGARGKIQEAVAEAYLKAASDAGIFFFKAPEISLEKLTIISMSKNLPPTEFELAVVYTADGGGELSASVHLSITADGIKVSVTRLKTPFGDSSEEIGRAVIADLSERTGLSFENFKIQSVEARNWPDGCLGLQEPGSLCTMAIVPGYRFVVVDASGKNYVYRTGRTAGRIKLEPEKEAPSLKLASLPADVEAGYKGFNAGRTLLSIARGYGKVNEANAEEGMKRFNLISDNRSSATAQGEFVFSSEKGFSLDALTGLFFKGSMKNFVLVFVDAAGRSVQQKVSLKNSDTENIVGIDFSANPDFDAANIRSFRILHSQRERVELTVGYGLLPETNRFVNPIPEENFELEGKAFDSSRLTILPSGVQGEVFGTQIVEGQGQVAYASLLDGKEGKKITYHFAGSEAGMAGYEVSLNNAAGSANKLEIALKGDGKAVELVMIRDNGEAVTKTVVLPKDFMNYELEAGIKQLFIRTTRLMAGHDKGSFLVRFGNPPPVAEKLIASGRSTVPERLRAVMSKLREAHNAWKERYKNRKFSFTRAK